MSTLVEFFKYPIFSISEMKFIPIWLSNIVLPSNYWVLRFFSLITIIFTIFSLLKLFKNKTVGLLVLISTPWLLIISKELNFYSIIILIFLSISTIYRFNNFFKWVLITVLLLILAHSTNFRDFFNLTSIFIKIKELPQFFSIITLFFQMEPYSKYLFVSKVGYYQLFILPFLVIGIISIIKNCKWQQYLIYLIISFIIYLIMSINGILIFSGIAFLFTGQLIIIEGINQLTNKKIVVLLIIISSILYSIYFWENYLRHYQIKYSWERGYAKQHVAEYLLNKPQYQIYMLSDSDIEYLINIYSRHYPTPSIHFVPDIDQWPKFINKCNLTKSICIFNEEAMDRLKFNKDSQEFEFIRNADGGKAYFITK